MSFRDGEERRFDGEYVAHWEVSRFETVDGTRLFGLLNRVERCQLETGEGVESIVDRLFGGKMPEDWRHSPGARFAVTFDGKVLERGRFGHRGWCRWRLLVKRWLKVERIS